MAHSFLVHTNDKTNLNPSDLRNIFEIARVTASLKSGQGYAEKISLQYNDGSICSFEDNYTPVDGHRPALNDIFDIDEDRLSRMTLAFIDIFPGNFTIYQSDASRDQALASIKVSGKNINPPIDAICAEVWINDPAFARKLHEQSNGRLVVAAP